MTTVAQTMPALKSIDSRVDRRFLKRLPAFSPVAIRLLLVLSDERTSFKEVARLIALDPILSGEVLRLANSGLYGRRFEVRSILQAIALLGIGRINQIVVTAALWRGLPHRTAPFVRDWWRHSIASALVAQQIDEDRGTDFAYTAALLHGVGQLALFEDAPSDYPGLVERAYTESFDLLEHEHVVFGVDHAGLAGLILETWGLPETMRDAVARHHESDAHALPDTRLVHAVQIGCIGAEHAGFGQCGCHQQLAKGIPVPLNDLFAGDYPISALVAGVNQIECSLL